MNRSKIVGLVSLVATVGVGALGLAACGDSEETPSGGTAGKGGKAGSAGSLNGGGGLDNGGGGTDNGGAGGGGGIDPTKVQVRVAHFSADAGAVNVCVRPNASGSAGGAAGDAGAAGASGGGEFVKLGDVAVDFKQITAAYVEANAGKYDVRLVASDKTCAEAGIVADVTAVELPGGKQVTVLAEGKKEAGFALKVLTDMAPTADKASVRLVHASPSTTVPVDAGVYGGDKKFVKVFANVSNTDAVAAAGGGYVMLDSAVAKDSPLEVRNGETGAYVATVGAPGEVAVGAVASIYAYDPATGTGPGVAFCADGDAGQNGVITCADAALVDRKTEDDVTLRLAHMASAVSSAVKACAKPTSFPTWTANQYASASLAQYNTTGDQSLPNNGGAFRADAWDVKLVAANAADCTADALPNATFSLETTAGLKATAVVAGDAAGTGVGLYAIAQDTAKVDGQFKARLIHVASGAPTVDVGRVGDNNALTVVWTNAEFGKAATGAGPNLSFASGYVQGAVQNGVFGAAPAGSTTATFKTASALTPNADTSVVYTYYIVGATGDAGGIKIVRCVDSGENPSCGTPFALASVQ